MNNSSNLNSFISQVRNLLVESFPDFHGTVKLDFDLSSRTGQKLKTTVDLSLSGMGFRSADHLSFSEIKDLRDVVSFNGNDISYYLDAEYHTGEKERFHCNTDGDQASILENFRTYLSQKDPERSPYPFAPNCLNPDEFMDLSKYFDHLVEPVVRIYFCDYEEIEIGDRSHSSRVRLVFHPKDGNEKFKMFVRKKQAEVLLAAFQNYKENRENPVKKSPPLNTCW